MYVSKIKNKYRKVRKARLCQGDILTNVNFSVGCEGIKFDDVTLQYAIVMNQDCDLSTDYKACSQNKNKNHQSIPSILLCPAYPADQFFSGEHMEDWELRQFMTREKEKIINNDEFKRYHYLESDNILAVPKLVIDFKHFYTVPRDIIYFLRKKAYIATVNELYREELSQRFSFFLSRIGLPENQ